jgi:hypothetical protein
MISWGLVGLDPVRVGSSWPGSWYAAGAKPVCMFWLQVATGVTPVRLKPLITVGNLGAWSCLDIV